MNKNILYPKTHCLYEETPRIGSPLFSIAIIACDEFQRAGYGAKGYYISQESTAPGNIPDHTVSNWTEYRGF